MMGKDLIKSFIVRFPWCCFMFIQILKDYCDMHRLYQPNYTQKDLLFYKLPWIAQLCHTDYIFSALCFFSYDFEDYCDMQRLYHINYTHKVTLQYSSFMYLESFLMGNGFITLDTFIRSLSNMPSFINLKMTITFKSLDALVTFKEFLSSMHSLEFKCD